MAALEKQSDERLRAAILTEGQQESTQVILLARTEADALLSRAKAEAEKLRQEKMTASRTEATKRRELILATVAVEAARDRRTAIEILLKTILDKARERLMARRDIDYRATLVALASDAIHRMNGDTFVIKIHPNDRTAFGDGLSEAIRIRLGRSRLTITVLEEPGIDGGGLLVQDAAGRQVFDNRLLTRLERLWPELRRHIAIRTALVSEDSTPIGKA